MSAPAAAAAVATSTPASEPKGDRENAIVDSLNRQLARWLDQHHDRTRTCGTATELAFDADVSGLAKAGRARLRQLLIAQGFSVAPGVMTYADSGSEQELFAIYRTIPATGKREKDEQRQQQQQQQQRTECCGCAAPATRDGVKLPTCAHIFCLACVARMPPAPACQCRAVCRACGTGFRLEDMRHLDGSAYDDAQPPPSKRQRTDAAVEASE